MKWETVIGVEVHAELSTRSKIFCGCSTAFGGEPNTHVCPICAGMPGTLPKLNRKVLEYAVLTGLALNCKITRRCKFDRKNYFYPDLPKAYQISQLYYPICRDGFLTIETQSGEKTIGIRQIHMEEDAGKLIHQPNAGKTQMDFNRCGVPLLEIVTSPDFRSGAEVIAYLERLRETLLYLGVSDCKMQEGSLRADVNISVRIPGGELGVRTEMKNINSFKAIGRAIEHESERQREILRRGGTVVQETRRWDDTAGQSSAMRSKENAHDYRYFPEPDLLPIEIEDEWIGEIRNRMPELAQQKRKRYAEDYGLTEHDAAVITGHKRVSDLFEETVRQSGNPKESAHLITGEIMRLISQTSSQAEDLTVDAGKLAVLIKLLTAGEINRGAYKEAVEAVFTQNADPERYIEQNGLRMVSDESEIIKAVEAAVLENPDAVSDYKAGREKAFGFLMGQVMRGLNGAGNPDAVRAQLIRKLK